MCAARRTTSTRLTRLAAKASPYHDTVTLYEVTDTLDTEKPQAEPSTSRRATRRRVKREPVGSESEALDPDAVQKAPKPNSKPKAKAKAKGVLQPLDVPHPTPAKWAEAYDAIKEMRARVMAPVDTMGCDQAQHGEQDPKNQRFATLVSLMLSSQTKDEVTDAAVSKLRAALGGAISVQAMIDADDAVISEAIAKVGFWRRKTQYLKQTAQKLSADFDADVPKTVDELCSLPGVGPKMAFLALQVAWKLNVGIGVDVHVHRITNRLGWHARPTKNPEETRRNLESWLPKPLHGEINHVLVGFGQTICLPVGPKCGECALSGAGLCPSAQNARSRAKSSKAAVRKLSESDAEAGAGPRIKMEMQGKGEPCLVKEEE